MTRKASRVLIVEDERLIARNLEHLLYEFGYLSAGIATSGSEALQKVRQVFPDVVLMDIRLRGELDGVATARALLEKMDVPIVFLTAHADEATLERVKEVTPHGYLLKPIDGVELRVALEIALAKHRAERELRALNEELRAERERSTSFAALLRATVEHLACGVAVTDANGIVITLNQPIIDVFRSTLRIDEVVGQHAGSLIFGPSLDVDDPAAFKRRVLQLARDGKPVAGDRVHFRDGRVYSRDFAPVELPSGIGGHVWSYYDVTHLEEQRESLVREMNRDSLTAISNRRGLEIIVGSCLLARLPFTLLFVDLNAFKAINDSYGHAAGDAVLVEVARKLSASTRELDQVARLAGDEFVVVARNTSGDGAVVVRSKLEQALSFEMNWNDIPIKVSASVGAASFPDDGATLDALLVKADERMYEAKNRSRPRSIEPR